MKNLIVVLLGGLSGEREISFLTGRACSQALKKRKYLVKELDAKGNFIEELKKLKPKLVFNALHGRFGEDGFVQSILESLKIAYTHSGVISSSLAMDKQLSRVMFKKNGIKVPKSFLLQKTNDKKLFKKIKIKKIKNKFKDFNEDRKWQIKSWKKNNEFFKIFLKKNNLSLFYAFGSYYYLLFKILRIRDLNFKLFLIYFRFYLFLPINLLKKILKIIF